MNDAKAIVIGTSHHNTLSMVRALGMSQIDTSVIIYGSDKSFVSHTRFAKEVLFFNNVDDVISHLKAHYCSTAYKPIVISCTDEIAHKLDMHQNELMPYIHFFHTDTQGDLTQYMDKFKQIELAKHVGFKVPWSSIYDVQFDVDSIVYPCLLKPVASINGGKHICICNSLNEFNQSIKEFDGVETLVQELVPKDEEVVVVGLTIEGQFYIPAYISKIREINGGTTYSKVCDISKIPLTIIKLCEQMVATIGYEGLWGIECIVRNGDYYFLELNLRNDATTYSIVTAGVNLPYMYVVSKMGGTIDYSGAIKEIYSIVEHNDFIYAVKHHIGLVKWYKSYKNAKCRYLFQKGDRGPGSSLLKQYLSLARNRVIRR